MSIVIGAGVIAGGRWVAMGPISWSTSDVARAGANLLMIEGLVAVAARICLKQHLPGKRRVP